MKGTIVFIFCSLLYCSCNEHKDGMSKKIAGSTDSNQTMPIQRDTFSASEQRKFIENIEFGLPKKEAEKRIREFEKAHDRSSRNTYYLYSKIGNWDFSKLRGKYINDSLYQLDIIGAIISFDDYNSEINGHVSAVDLLIRDKYGKPFFELPIPERFRLERGYDYNIKKWKIGAKTIDINIHSGSGVMYTWLSIYNQKSVDRIMSDQKREADSLTNSGKGVF